MWKEICIATLALGLSACQTSKIEKASPIRLTPSQLSDIKESVAWDLQQHFYFDIKGSEAVKIGQVAGAATSKKLLLVCGYVRVQESGGGFSDEMLFQGIYNDFPSRLHNDRVSTSMLAKTPEANARVRAFCRDLGVEI